MSAVWMRLRSELRIRWRAWLGLALVIGLAGAVAAAAAAGARRTETAYPRFVQAQNGYDLITGGGFPGTIDPGRALARMEAMPEVREWARVDMAQRTCCGPSSAIPGEPLPLHEHSKPQGPAQDCPRTAVDPTRTLIRARSREE